MQIEEKAQYASQASNAYRATICITDIKAANNADFPLFHPRAAVFGAKIQKEIDSRLGTARAKYWTPVDPSLEDTHTY